ncbi:hypothetical protein H4R33_004681 [Dimargaris cristalligena]|nr:hypothetical protein H4R33_004681 [Dimargaris cristalligena]
MPGKRSTYTQFILVAAIYFCASASYLIVNGIGGGGLKDPSIAAQSNLIANIVSLVTGLFAGAFHNYLGPRISLLLGCIAYLFFGFSYLIYGWTNFKYIIYIAGAFFGLIITLFWTAQGSLMLSYPTEEHRSKYLTTFFVAFSASGAVGGILTFSLNFNNTGLSLGTATYWAAIAVAGLGVALVFLLRPNSALIRDDGTSVPEEKFQGWLVEVRGLSDTLRNRHILMLIPLFMFLGTYFTYITNCYNLSLFRIRTRGLNVIFFSVFGTIGSLAFGLFMRKCKLPTRQKGLLATLIFTTLICASWISAYFVQRPVKRGHTGEVVDFEQPYYWSIIIIYCIWGFLDSSLNAFGFWILGYLTNDTQKQARYTAFTRFLQSTGGVLSWGIDSAQVPYILELWVTFTFLILAMVSAATTITSIKFPKDTDSMETNSMNLSLEEETKYPSAKVQTEKTNYGV